MSYSDLIILLARQRSGTHAVGSLLDSHPEIKYHEEIFLVHKEIEDPTNFFFFTQHFCTRKNQALAPHDYEPIFLEYLAYLRSLSKKRFLLLAVNSICLLLARRTSVRAANFK